MEIVLFQATPYKNGNAFLNPLLQHAITVDNPIALMSPSSAITDQFLADRADATVFSNVAWTQLLFSAAPTGIDTPEFIVALVNSIQHFSDQFLSKIDAFQYQAESTMYDSTIAILHTAGFTDDPAINSNILASYNTSKVTIVRDGQRSYLLICPQSLATWFFTEFKERQQDFTAEVISSVQGGQSTYYRFQSQYELYNGDETFKYLAKRYEDRVRILNLEVPVGESPASMLKHFALKIVGDPYFRPLEPNNTWYYITFFGSLFLFFLFMWRPFRLSL